DLPFIVGVYDTKFRKGASSASFSKPIGKGYNWYKFPQTVHLPPNGYIYATRSWTTQLPTADAELANHDFNIWVSVKFTGPKFFADSQDKNYIYIDRIVLIEPEKKQN
ncbi:MAG: hypothetical protein IJS15_02540, partial [Victivallales bacterium]|nr:hypothetical protein [Victivallales bacterium]